MVEIMQALRCLSAPSGPGKWQRKRNANMALAIASVSLLILSLALGFYDLASATAFTGAISFGLSLVARAKMRAAIRGAFE